MAYWLDLFTVETWREFKGAGGEISGFRQSRWVRVKKMKPGDRLLCYVVGLKRWVGVLEVVGEPWNGTEPQIWSSDSFPARVNVRVAYELTPETGVPAIDLLPEMPMFDKLDGTRGWGAFFMGSPAQWHDADANVVVKAIENALANPVARPIPKSALRKRPRIVETPELGTVAIPDADDDEESLPEEPPSAAPHEREHTEIQALLTRMGRAMGHDVFIARNDRSQTWQGKVLSDLPGVVDTLPTHFNDATDRVVEPDRCALAG